MANSKTESPNSSILSLCVSLVKKTRTNPTSSIVKMKQIHGFSIRRGVSLGNPTFCKHLIYTLISFFSSSSSLVYASKIFLVIWKPTTFTYNTLIRGYAESPSPHPALPLYSRMHSTSTPADSHTFPFLLKAISKSTAASYAGPQAHSIILKTGFSSLTFVCNSLLTMYSSLGQHHHAYLVFRSMPLKDTVSWNSLINGYVLNGRPNEALTLFKNMASQGVKPDEFTLLSIVNTCTELGALSLGRRVHLHILKQGLLNTHSSNSLLNLYSKSGNTKEALMVFQDIEKKNIVSWNSLIVGLAVNGMGEEAVQVFQKLEEEEASVRPTDVTFVGVLYGCAHCGMVTRGRKYMKKMEEEYGIVAGMEHYGCMVDLLGRGGLVEEAYGLVKEMMVKGIEPSVVIWRMLLSACWMHGYLGLGKEVGRMIFERGGKNEEEEENGGEYVMLSNLYAMREEWGEVGVVREEGRRGRRKSPGVSMVEVGNRVYEFVRGGGGRDERRISEKVREMSRRVKERGYVVCTRSVYVDVEEEEKEEALVYHSEKMAVAFVVMITGGDGGATPIRVTKNLRICGDCHCWIRVVSRVYGRDIVVRDPSRFHHFSRGSCSCNEYW